ncbi:MAG: response regulator [Anaerolineae bacterium]|nr:response regulator [Anaerolineae bacterium]
MKVLYLEDDPNDTHLVDLYVSASKHQLISVQTVEQAWRALDQAPQLILVDVILGATRSGVDFARLLRGRGNKTPMVAVTALATAADVHEYRSAGFDDVLTKPFTIMQLAQTIERQLPMWGDLAG